VDVNGDGLPTFLGTSTAGVVVAATGQLLGFDLTDFAASVATVFAPPPGQAVAAAQALSDGHVVAALEGGAVVNLAPAGTGAAGRPPPSTASSSCKTSLVTATIMSVSSSSPGHS
jgi:hypothetical protein